MEVASSRPDHLPALSVAKTYELYPLIALFAAERPMPAMLLRHLLQCARDIEAGYTNSEIVMDFADRNRETRLMRRANLFNNLYGHHQEIHTLLIVRHQCNNNGYL